MKAWSLFLKDVMPHVPGCPEPVAEHAVLRAAQDFFDTTRLWRQWLPEDFTMAGETEYTRLLPNRTALVRLERATLAGCPIAVRSEDELPADWQAYPQQVCTGVHTSDRKTFILLPPQDSGLSLMLEVSLKPAEDAQGIEDHLFAHHVRHIAAGAVAALKGHTDKTYSDADGALLWAGRFASYTAEADFRRFRGYSSARPRRQIKTF